MTDTADADFGDGAATEIPPIGLYDGDRDPDTRERCGQGKVTYANADTYVGGFAGNVRHGSGRYEWHGALKDPNADPNAPEDAEEEEEEEAEEEEGEDGQRKKKEPKAVYVGEYKDGARTGKGKLTYPDGANYQGDFVDGKRHGEGIYEYPNGDVYTGAWQNDERHGVGEYVYAITKVKIQGEWQNGYLHGTATVTTSHHVIRNVTFENGAIVKAETQEVEFKDGTKQQMGIIHAQAPPAAQKPPMEVEATA